MVRTVCSIVWVADWARLAAILRSAERVDVAGVAERAGVSRF